MSYLKKLKEYGGAVMGGPNDQGYLGYLAPTGGEPNWEEIDKMIGGDDGSFPEQEKEPILTVEEVQGVVNEVLVEGAMEGTTKIMVRCKGCGHYFTLAVNPDTGRPGALPEHGGCPAGTAYEQITVITASCPNITETMNRVAA